MDALSVRYPRGYVYTKRACKRRVFHANENRTDHYGRSRSDEEIFRCGRNVYVALRPRCSENENCEGKHGVRFMGKNRAKRVTAWNELDAEKGDLRGRGI